MRPPATHAGHTCRPEGIERIPDAQKERVRSTMLCASFRLCVLSACGPICLSRMGVVFSVLSFSFCVHVLAAYGGGR